MGHSLPFDPDYVTYVWFDALTNYLSIPRSRGEEAALWPADIHVIGKDILKFLAVYWPIMLKAAGLQLPKQVLVHGWWQKDNQKMSKSTGNVVDPVTVIDDWGLDAFSYYVVRELAIGQVGNWTVEGFASRYGAELANGLGNLINRSLSANRYRDGVVPEPSEELSAEAIATRDKLVNELKSSDLQGGLRTIWAYIARVNQYVDQTAPFKMAKDPEQVERLGEVLYNLVESCRLLAVWLQPYLPDTSRRMREQLGVPTETVNIAESGWGELAAGIGQQARAVVPAARPVEFTPNYFPFHSALISLRRCATLAGFCFARFFVSCGSWQVIQFNGPVAFGPLGGAGGYVFLMRQDEFPAGLNAPTVG